MIDCQIAGVSGDMLLSALLDLAVEKDRVISALRSIPKHYRKCRTIDAKLTTVKKRGFRASHIEIHPTDEPVDMAPREMMSSLQKLLDEVGVSSSARKLGLSALDTLIEVEGRLHGEDYEKVHLHEVSSSDTFADILGVCMALDQLKLLEDTVGYITPVALGGGVFSYSHGTMTAPAPATLEILRLKGLKFQGGPEGEELTTPTGAALLAALNWESTTFYPSMTPQLVGYGAGTKDLPNTPNVLRVVVGEETADRLVEDAVHILETNLDDVGGETLGHTIERLLAAGARDAWLIPTYQKKTRPGHMLQVVADRDLVDELIAILIEETGTLGVREYSCKRHVLSREMKKVEFHLEGVRESVNVKVARDRRGKVLRIKPEYDDIRLVAEKHSLPLRQVADLVSREAEKVLEEGS